jgi:phosphatidylserine/phosphatidylglycerophosphate/cardiolipin synthase-like enzyme
MIERLADLPPHLRARLATALDSGLITAPYSAVSLRAAGLDGPVEETATALSALRDLGVQGSAAAAWLRTLESAVGKGPEVDLVWTGPEVTGLHARDTRRVYEELLGSVESSVWVSTYAYFDGSKVFDVLSRRMDAVPSLQVSLMLNIQRKWGDKTKADQLVRQFADRFWGKDWPGESRPAVFYDPRSLDLEGEGSVLHAKAVVADRESVFITSANLTDAAWDRNIELGLLVRDSALALSMVSHFSTLIERGLLSPLPHV